MNGPLASADSIETAVPPVGDLVRRHRADRTLSQEDLAERAGLSVRTVSDIECGVALTPRAMTLALLARALQLDADAHEQLRVAARSRGAAAPQGKPAGRSRTAGPRPIGRERELADLMRLVRSQDVRLLTLTGTAGVGKTVVATAAAQALASECGFASTVVDLSALSDSALVPTKVALTLGLRDVPGSSVIETMATALTESAAPALLVLDTLEHLLEIGTFISELLKRAPTLTIIATSRAPLRLAIEREYPIKPLAVPPPETGGRVQELGRVASVRLLIDRACATRPTFALTAENAPGVAALVTVLGGLPLAIDLAAPRLKLFSPAALAMQLERRLLALDDGPHDLPARQRTLRGALNWSYTLLSAEAQQLFRRLAVFAGTFDAGAAAHVHGTTDDGGLTALRLVGALVDQNLLSVEDRDGEPAFVFSTLIRQYAIELLDASGERDAAYRALFEWMLTVASSVALRDPATHHHTRLERLARESSNLDEVFAWAEAAADAESGLLLAFALWGFWWLRGSFEEGLTRLRPLLALAEDHPGSVCDQTLSEGYREASGLSEARGELDDAERYNNKGLAIKQYLRDEASVAKMLNGLGVLRSRRGDYPGARESFAEALRLRRGHGDDYMLAQTLTDFGYSAANEGATGEAQTYLEEALIHFRAAESDLGSAVVLTLFALIALRSGDVPSAQAFSLEGANLARSVGHAVTIAFTTFVSGRIAVASQAFRDAIATLGAALAMFEKYGDFSSVADVLDALACAAIGLEEPVKAARLVGAGAALRARHRLAVVPAERVSHEAMLAKIGALLGAQEFLAQQRLARAVRLDQLLDGLGWPTLGRGPANAPH